MMETLSSFSLLGGGVEIGGSDYWLDLLFDGFCYIYRLFASWHCDPAKEMIYASAASPLSESGMLSCFPNSLIGWRLQTSWYNCASLRSLFQFLSHLVHSAFAKKWTVHSILSSRFGTSRTNLIPSMTSIAVSWASFLKKDYHHLWMRMLLGWTFTTSWSGSMPLWEKSA